MVGPGGTQDMKSGHYKYTRCKDVDGVRRALPKKTTETVRTESRQFDVTVGGVYDGPEPRKGS